MNYNRDKYLDPTDKWVGFEIINRIEFRCKKSGRCYR